MHLLGLIHKVLGKIWEFFGHDAILKMQYSTRTDIGKFGVLTTKCNLGCVALSKMEFQDFHC